MQVCVFYNGVQTNCLAIPAVDAHPGVFTLDGYYAAALNQDGSINSQTNPARVGSIVSIFATGLGSINPPQHDGAIVGLPLPVNVQPAGIYWYYFPKPNPIGGVQPNPYPVGATVLYAGPAPFEVAGASQINFILPDSGASELFLQVGEATSNAFQVYVGP